ncbi:MAG: LysE family transporter [Desulfobacterales bacterium]|nr:LysE family transporter [Desulfobacterales bacterium]
MTTYLIFGITYAFAAAAQPGPFQTYIISQTLSRGWKHTLPAAFAPLLSDVPIIALTLIVLSQVRVEFFRFLHCGGGIFLLYLAIRSFAAWRHFDAETEMDVQSGHQTLFNAAIVNLLNPNPYVGWSLIMGPMFLRGWREAPVNGLSLLVSFYATMIICTVGIIMLFAFARKLGPRVNRFSLGLSTAGLAGFGIYQLWLGITLFLAG